MGGMFANVTSISAISMALAQVGPLALEEGRIQGAELKPTHRAGVDCD